MPYPLNDSILDAYMKKTVGYFTFGGEVAWLTGEANDFTGNGVADKMNAVGLSANLIYEYHRFKGFLDLVYASGDNDLTGDHMNGFVLLHRNRSPGLILGRELLGSYLASPIGMGSHLVYGNDGAFSGVWYLRPGARFDWTPSLSSGAELILSNKAAPQAGEPGFLGVELDLGTEYAVYKNFDVGVNLGFLFPGAGLAGTANTQSAFAIQTVASVKF